MKKYLTLSVLTLFLMFTSCSILDNIIPDVDTSFSHTFYIEIKNSTGSSSEEILDPESSEDYDDFKKNIKGFKVNRITYEITDLNVPANMYFQGGVYCTETISNETVTAANIPLARFADLPGVGNEVDTNLDQTAINKLKNWLDDPGSFRYSAFYILTDSNSNSYNIPENTNYNFRIKVKFYVTVLTGL